MSTAPRPSPLLLSRATADDLDEVMRIMGCSFDAGFGEGWTRSQCAGILPMSGVVMTLAGSILRQPCGFSLFRAVADEAELLLIAVAPEARRCGIGSALIKHFIDHATNGGARRLHLEVRDGNPALALYHSAGFEAVGRRRNYYRGANGAQFDAITLVRDGVQ